MIIIIIIIIIIINNNNDQIIIISINFQIKNNKTGFNTIIIILQPISRYY
jgi:hypothetical protein